MNQALWKKLLSYFIEFHIESTSSAYNPHLYVSLKQGRYQLSTANAVYSYSDLYSNFTRTFQKLDLDALAIEEVLILGMGLGSIPYMLEKKFEKDYNYTCVEIDEEIVYLANKYVLKTLNSPQQTICADAGIFVEQCQRRYQLICMDIFLDDLIPNQFEHLAFLEKLRDLLAKDGLLLYNRLAVTRADIDKTRIFFEKKFRKVFPEASYLDVGGNWMLLNRADLLK